MNAKKLTSLGILLIAVVVCAGGIFLLHHFTLQPYVEAEQQAGFRQQAIRTERAARAVLRTQREALSRACEGWAAAPAWRRADGEATKTPFEAFAQDVLFPAAVDLAWLTGPDGAVRSRWLRKPDVDRLAALDGMATRAASALPAASSDGLVKIGSEVALVAGRAIPTRDGEVAARLWVGRYLDAGMLDTLSAAVGAPIVRVAGRHLPPGINPEPNAPHALWTADGDALAVAWALQGVDGQKLGYLRADVSVAHARRQADLARRNARIVLALSVGLCALVIVGVHVLIAGPVFRLLHRVQRLESGEENVSELTRDLHGEPRVLAGRLESTFEKLASMSKKDQLTQLSNRAHFEQVFSAFYHQARRYNRPLSLIILDIDFFKAVNDAGGHQAGDELLKSVAASIERICRKADLSARLGGDEFAVLLPETSSDNAAVFAERLRCEICAQSVWIRGMEANVTASVGIADLNAGEIDSPDAMQSLADRAMYVAKDQGRNRVFQACDLDEGALACGEGFGGDIDVLSKKLVGLDTQFKEMFVEGLEEVMEILAHRDRHMVAHARKVQRYAIQIAEEMELPDRVIKRLRIGAILHDIGMLAMPDSVLLCQGELDEDQLRLMRRHPLLSVRIMERMEFLEQEIPTVRYHHEHVDGSGYPEGLVGAAIPLTARIISVADAFDAMTSPRTFRSAKSVTAALGELRGGAGAQFDPAVVEAFVAVAGRLGDKLVEAIPSYHAAKDTSAAISSELRGTNFSQHDRRRHTIADR
ncbi:MAG: diguanylate cyclase [Phycisphaerae bacterium]|nr:diguanylate cyclase [Phycisphaerae bacterium]